MADTCPAARRRIGLDAMLNSGDTHKYALKDSSYTPGQTDYSAADGFEASGAGYTPGGNTVTGITNATGTNKAFGDFADPSFPSVTLPDFQWGVLYRTSDNKVVLEQDLGVQVVSGANVTIQQPTAAEGTAAVRL